MTIKSLGDATQHPQQHYRPLLTCKEPHFAPNFGLTIGRELSTCPLLYTSHSVAQALEFIRHVFPFGEADGYEWLNAATIQGPYCMQWQEDCDAYSQSNVD